jgi:hypothetical protein
MVPAIGCSWIQECSTSNSMRERSGREASTLWAKSRLRDRIDAIVAHEHLEAQGKPHEELVQRAPDTELPIGENARKILRSMAEGAKGER